MKDFKSYSKEHGGDKKGGADDAFQKDKGVKMIRDIAYSMKGRSSGDIMRAVIEEAERGKRAGTLKNEDLDNFYSLTAPSLDAFRRRKLKSIVERLKRI